MKEICGIRSAGEVHGSFYATMPRGAGRDGRSREPGSELMISAAITKLHLSRLRKIAEIAIACAATWILLESTSAYIGRGAAWALGLIILVAVIVALFRRKR